MNDLKRSLIGSALAALLATSGLSASAATLNVNLAGWQTFGNFRDPTNTQAFYTLPTGSLVTGYTYTGLTFATNGDSYLSEFTLSVNNASGSLYLDWVPSEDDAPGTFGPASGAYGGATGFGGGAPFTVGAGSANLWVTVYEQFDDLGLDATVSAGTLTISYTAPVPEAGTNALMGLGLLGVAFAAHRRRV